MDAVYVFQNLKNNDMFCSLFSLFRAAHLAYGSSWAEDELELQLPAYATATATPDLGHVCNLHHSSQQHWILNPLSKARDRTLNLMVPSQIHFQCATVGIPKRFLMSIFHI